MTVNDRVLAAAARILDAGERPDAVAIRPQVGSDVDVTAAIRELAAGGYVRIIDVWQDNAIVREITPDGRRRLAEATPRARARRFAGRAADRLGWQVMGGVLVAFVLLYLGLR